MDDWINSLLSAGTSQITVTAWGNSDAGGKPAPAAVQAVAPEIDESPIKDNVPTVPRVAAAANDIGFTKPGVDTTTGDRGFIRDIEIGKDTTGDRGFIRDIEIGKDTTGDRGFVSDGIGSGIKPSNFESGMLSDGIGSTVGSSEPPRVQAVAPEIDESPIKDNVPTVPKVAATTNDSGISSDGIGSTVGSSEPPRVQAVAPEVSQEQPTAAPLPGTPAGELQSLVGSHAAMPSQPPPPLAEPPEGGIRSLANARATLGVPPPPEISEPGPAFGPGVDAPFMGWRAPNPAFHPGANFGGGLGGSPAGSSSTSGSIVSSQSSGTDSMFTSLLNFADASTQAHLAASMKLDELARIIRNSM